LYTIKEQKPEAPKGKTCTVKEIKKIKLDAQRLSYSNKKAEKRKKIFKSYEPITRL